jgi:hypothetical protein
MDFSQIHGVAILPLFPEGTEDQVFSGAFGSKLESALTTRQSQWRFVSARETLQVINTRDLGRGYKNLQADFNASGTEMGQIVFAPATNVFIRELGRATKTNAFLVGTYSLDQPLLGGTLGSLFSSIGNGTGSGTRVKISLLYANGSSLESWWTAVVKRSKINDQTLQEMAESIAANIGKGTLRQL